MRRTAGLTCRSTTSEKSVDTRVDAYLDWIEAKVPGVLARAPVETDDDGEPDDGDGDTPSCAATPAAPFACVFLLAILRRRRR